MFRMAQYRYYYYSTEVQGCNVSNYSKVANTGWLRDDIQSYYYHCFQQAIPVLFLAHANIEVVNSYMPSFPLLSYHTANNRKLGVGTSKQIHSWFARQGIRRPSYFNNPIMMVQMSFCLNMYVVITPVTIHIPAMLYWRDGKLCNKNCPEVIHRCS